MPLPSPIRQHELVVSIVRRRGVFPGSFNPLTIAHLEIALRAKDACNLHEVHLVVSEVALDKPDPEGPPFDERISLLEADASEFDWLVVKTTREQLIADIAAGYDIVVMGADKWHQVNDLAYYADAAARDAAVAGLPNVVVAPRTGSDTPTDLELETAKNIRDVSSTAARAGDRSIMAPHAAARWTNARETDSSD